METVNEDYTGPKWETTAPWLIEKHKHQDACFAMLHELMPTFPDGHEKEFLLEIGNYPFSSLAVIRTELETLVKENGLDVWKSKLDERYAAINEMCSGVEIAAHGIKGVDEKRVFS